MLLTSDCVLLVFAFLLFGSFLFFICYRSALFLRTRSLRMFYSVTELALFVLALALKHDAASASFALFLDALSGSR